MTAVSAAEVSCFTASAHTWVSVGLLLFQLTALTTVGSLFIITISRVPVSDGRLYPLPCTRSDGPHHKYRQKTA